MPVFPAEAEKSRAAKIALRSQMLASRRSLTTIELAAAAASVQAVVRSLVRAQHPSVAAPCWPTGAEPGGPDLPAVLADAMPLGGRLLLPVLLDDGDLDWARFTGTLER